MFGERAHSNDWLGNKTVDEILSLKCKVKHMGGNMEIMVSELATTIQNPGYCDRYFCETVLCCSSGVLGTITKGGKNRTGNIGTPLLFSPDLSFTYILNITCSSGLLKKAHSGT